MKEDPHSWAEIIMHASHIKKTLQPKFLILFLKFQNLQFYDKENFRKIRYVFNENIDKFWD